MAAYTIEQVDPVFAAVARAVHGDGVDVRELWSISKSMPDSSAVSTSGQASSGKKKKLAAGLLIGAGIEGLAAGHTIKPLVAGIKEAKPALSAAKGLKQTAAAVKPLVAGPAKKVVAGEAAPLTNAALQVGNLGVGLGAAKELVGPSQKKGATTVSKAKLNAAGIVSANARARRVGLRLVTGTAAAGGAAGGYAAGRHRPARAAVPTGVNLPSPTTRSQVTKGADLEVRCTISKLDTDKMQAFGWANVAIVNGEIVEDLQGDYVNIDEIEKSAYAFMLNSRKGGHQHQRIGKSIDLGPVHVADVIESFVVTPEKLEAMGLARDALPWGWWNGMQVYDPGVWADVKSGKLTGFSIHGSGVRKDLVLT